MINLLSHLEAYASFFAERNRNALVQIELFLRREITQLFLENELEIMSQFKLSC